MALRTSTQYNLYMNNFALIKCFLYILYEKIYNQILCIKLDDKNVLILLKSQSIYLYISLFPLHLTETLIRKKRRYKMVRKLLVVLLGLKIKYQFI